MSSFFELYQGYTVIIELSFKKCYH